MKNSSRIMASIILTTAAFATVVSGTEALPDAKSLGLIELKDDFSRQQLFEEILATDPVRQKEYESFAVKKAFKFPSDVNYDEALKQPRKDSIFGVDISHHNGKDFPVELLAQNKSVFIFMKASQGAGYLDPHFASFWRRAGDAEQGVKLHRGAYHFLSSGMPDDNASEWGRKQALTFVKIIKANGGLRETDMPPAVDVEWDIQTKGGADQWAKRKPDEIIAMVKAFSKQVESDLGRKPMIYTARSWWVPRMGGEQSFSKLADHQLWIADYSNQSQASENPRSINNVKWAIWQFTDAAEFKLGSSKKFDANIFKGAASDFYSKLGVKEF